MTSQLGDEVHAFFQSLEAEPPTSVLLNPLKPEGHEFLHEQEQIPWNPWGRHLKSRPKFIRDPFYQGGAYYSQEASSMLLSQVVMQCPVSDDAVCLDLCAAPGGKSLILRSQLPERAYLISNDIHPSRSEILSENLLKWGHARHAVTKADAGLLGSHRNAFDLILVDAPCSGEGMFRKDPRAVQEWSLGHVRSCGTRQKGIISDILPALKPGGILIYSTCTFSEEENGSMEDFLLPEGLEPLKLDLDTSWGFQAMSENRNTYQAYPHKVKGEGFYMSVYRKSGDGNGSSTRTLKDHWSEWKGALPWTNIKEGYRVIEWKGRLYAADERMTIVLSELDRQKLLKRPGLPLGEWKGKDFIPHVGTALAPGWANAERIDMSLEAAWTFLRRGIPELQGPDRGWTLMTYKDIALGWAKWVNGRMKNHYPKDWRIRTTW